eukprot:10402947-Alexandrium_andersonii.AAC.1
MLRQVSQAAELPLRTSVASLRLRASLASMTSAVRAALAALASTLATRRSDARRGGTRRRMPAGDLG